MGVLVAIIGAVLIVAGIQDRAGPEVVVLGLGCAIGLIGIDVWYVLRKVIARIYLLDAAAELVLAAWWIFAQTR